MLLTSCVSESPDVKTSIQETQNVMSLVPVLDYSEISSSEIYTFTCEFIEQKPITSTPNCADFGEVVFDIKWQIWEPTGGEGIGIYSVNDCVPNCAEGTRSEYRAKVRLDGLKTDGKRFYLTDFSYVLENPGQSQIPTAGGWDNSDYFFNSVEFSERD